MVLMHSGRKGFIFTIDSLVAALIVTIAIIATFSVADIQPRETLILDRMSSDILVILEEEHVLDEANQTKINQTIDALVPEGLVYDYEITYYNVSGPALTVVNRINETQVAAGRDVIYAVRPVLIFTNESVSGSEAIEILELRNITRVKLGIGLP